MENPLSQVWERARACPEYAEGVRVGTTDKAKELRRNQTDAERTLWGHLRDRRLERYKFRRQRPLGKYIVDLICLEERLIVEVDGGQHSGRQMYDSERDEWLESQGYRVLRFWNNQVLNEIESVKEVILATLKDD